MTEFEPLYTEAAAAKAYGLKPRALRTERTAGRLGFKRIAGRIYYRQRDLERWLDKGEEPCPDETPARTSSSGRPAGRITSPTPRVAAAADVQQVLATAKKLKRRSRRSSRKNAENSSRPDRSGRVIPMKPPS